MRYRLLVLPAAGIAAVLVGVLLFGNLNHNLVYYLTPSEALAKRAQFPDGRRFRLGGQVVQGSLAPLADGVRFTITDGHQSVVVVHHGTPPQLFQQGASQGIGVVVEGAWAGGRFVSDTMLVKHDETYRPPGPGDATTPRAFPSGEPR